MLIVSLLFSSCYSYKPLMSKKDANAENVSEIITKIIPGDVYRITLKNGKRIDMKVIRVGNGQIEGSRIPAQGDATHAVVQDGALIYKNTNETLSETDIYDVRKRKFSALKTAPLIVIPTLGILSLILSSQSYWHGGLWK